MTEPQQIIKQLVNRIVTNHQTFQELKQQGVLEAVKPQVSMLVEGEVTFDVTQPETLVDTLDDDGVADVKEAIIMAYHAFDQTENMTAEEEQAAKQRLREEFGNE